MCRWKKRQGSKVEEEGNYFAKTVLSARFMKQSFQNISRSPPLSFVAS